VPAAAVILPSLKDKFWAPVAFKSSLTEKWFWENLISNLLPQENKYQAHKNTGPPLDKGVLFVCFWLPNVIYGGWKK
jgi:hypothetical protein